MASHISHNATLRLDSQCGTHTHRTPKNTRCCQKILTIDYCLFYSRIQQSTGKLFQHLHCFGNEKLGIWLHAFVQPAQINCFHVFALHGACIKCSHMRKLRALHTLQYVMPIFLFDWNFLNAKMILFDIRTNTIHSPADICQYGSLHKSFLFFYQATITEPVWMRNRSNTIEIAMSKTMCNAVQRSIARVKQIIKF